MNTQSVNNLPLTACTGGGGGGGGGKTKRCFGVFSNQQSVRRMKTIVAF